MKFNVGDHLYLRVSPTKCVQRFGIKGKLAPRYIGPYEIIEECGSMCRYPVAGIPTFTAARQDSHSDP